MDAAMLREFAAKYTAAWCGQNAASVAASFAEARPWQPPTATEDTVPYVTTVSARRTRIFTSTCDPSLLMIDISRSTVNHPRSALRMRAKSAAAIPVRPCDT